MILRSDEAAVGAHLLHWLVVRTMPVFQFVDGGTCCLCQQLVSHADTHAGTYISFFLFSVEEFFYVLYCIYCGVGVAWTIGKKKTIKIERVEIVVPWNSNHFNATTKEATDDVVLYAAIDENNFFAFPFTIMNHFLAGDLGNVVHSFILC